MEKFIVMPDSFKGTMSSEEVCQVVGDCLEKRFPKAQVVTIPIADGGEGTADAFLRAAGGEKIYGDACGPFGEPLKAFYASIHEGKTAVIELASCAGLPMAEGRLAPDKATTYGVGLLMGNAVDRGFKNLIVGIGGSATNDGGAGLAAALGARFLDENGKEFIPVGRTLDKVADIDLTSLRERLEGVTVTVMCDVDNPLLGPRGAAAVFSPQKGADSEMVALLERKMGFFADVLERCTGKRLRQIPGAGAAGGAGAGISGMLGGILTPGIDVMLDAVSFEEQLAGCGAVFTGEGRFDTQSLGGKAVIGIARRCKKAGVPVIALVGAIDGGLEEAYGQGVTAVFSINVKAEDFSVSRYRSRENLETVADNVLRLMQI